MGILLIVHNRQCVNYLRWHGESIHIILNEKMNNQCLNIVYLIPVSNFREAEFV